MDTMAFFKLIADADLNEDVIRGMRRSESSLDFMTASEGGTRGLKDRQVLELEAASGRILVSHDCNTMIGEFYRFIAEGHTSPGLIIVEQEIDEGDAIDDLLLIWAASSSEELRDLCDGCRFDLLTGSEPCLLCRVQLGVKRRIFRASFQPHPLKVRPLPAEILVDCPAIRQIIGDRTEDLLKVQCCIGSLNSFRRLPLQKGVHYGVQGHPSPCHVIAAITLFDVLHNIKYTVIHLSFWFPPVNRT
jgi:hypothetical protein